MTEAAKQFVGSLTFSNLSQQPVFSGLWDGNWTEHVHLGAWGDLMVVAPASANTLSKFALGICDNALTAVYLSAKCPVLVAPAMDADMYQHPSTFRNLNQLKKDGVQVLGVGTGFLASGLMGEGENGGAGGHPGSGHQPLRSKALARQKSTRFCRTYP